MRTFFADVRIQTAVGRGFPHNGAGLATDIGRFGQDHMQAPMQIVVLMTI